jgi:thioredoxin reductase (NADPH)
MLANPKVDVIYNATVTDILGDKTNGVHAVVLKDTQTGEEREFPTQGIFMAIGHDPNTKLFGHSLAKDEKGYLAVAPQSTETNVAGVFACGDVADSKYRQAISAAGTGCMAAIDAERYLDAAGLVSH